MAKYCLITGAATGIGYQLALAFHKKGYNIIGISTSNCMDGLYELEKKIGLVPIACDITDVDQIKAAHAKVQEITGGSLDILYNNAGVCCVGGPSIVNEEHLVKKLIEVNVIGHMYMTKHFGDMVIKATGKIVYTASVAALVPLSWTSVYCASKAAIDQYALVVRGEMKPYGVRVFSVITGGVRTGISDSLASSEDEPDYDYPEVRESIEASKSMVEKTSVTPQDYAKVVTDRVCNPSFTGFNIFAGWGCYLLYYLRLLAPVWLMEWGVQRHFKQDKAFARLKKEHEKRKRE